VKAGIEAKATYATPAPWVANIQSPKVRKYANYLETYLRYPKRLRRLAREFDVAHVTDQGYAHLLKGLPGPSVVTVHDLLAVRASLGEFDYWTVGPSGQAQQRIVLESLALATRAACVSTKTQSDVARLVPGLASGVIFNALYTDFSKHPSKRREPFFFCLGGNQPYKNRAGIVKIAGEVLSRPGFENHRFKVVGKMPDDAIDEAARATGVMGRIDYEVDPSNEKIGDIFKAAEGLFFLSRDEGFGLPILEGQSAGCWVVTTDKEPMREVAGDGATLAPEGGEADAIATAYADRGKVIERGVKNLKRFSVDAMAREYSALYKEVAA
jgi:glycosyltransferase involved in cell wall biosynthesis